MAGRKLISGNEKTELLTCKIDSGSKHQFQELAERHGLTVSQLLRILVDSFIRLKGNPIKK